MKRFVDTLNTISIIAAIIGIIYFYKGNYDVLYACAIVSLIASFFNVNFGAQNSFFTEIVAMFIGLIVATIKHGNIVNYISVAICYEGTLAIIWGPIVGLLFMHHVMSQSKEPKTIKVKTFVIVIVLLLAGCTGCFLYMQQYYGGQLSTLNSQLEDMTERHDSLLQQSETQATQLNKQTQELNFWEDHAVICTTEGKKYHHYGCGHLDGRSIYIFNIEYAKSLGYTPCLDCCKSIDWDNIKKKAKLMDEQQQQQQREDFAKVNGK